MMNYSELVRALRCKRDDCEGCDLAFFDKDEGWMCRYAAKDDDAADAIEELQAEVDALVHDNERYIQFNTDLLNTKEVSKDEMDEILEYLRNAPVVLLEPMRIEQLPKRGEWVGIEYDGYADGNPVYDVWECSECGEEHEGEEDTLTSYCPNCGAKMEVQDDKA